MIYLYMLTIIFYCLKEVQLIDRMVRMDHALNGAIILLIVVLSFGVFGTVTCGLISSNYTNNIVNSSCSSCFNVTAEDKRGIPTGANPLHNR